MVTQWYLASSKNSKENLGEENVGRPCLGYHKSILKWSAVVAHTCSANTQVGQENWESEAEVSLTRPYLGTNKRTHYKNYGY